MPAVTVPPRPNGLPTATTQSPTSAPSLLPQATYGSGLSALIFIKGEVGPLIAPDDLGGMSALVLEDDRDLLGVGDNMVVGDNVTTGIDDKA
jgi:hypothetical protein